MKTKSHPRETTYSYARAHFSTLCDRVAETHEPLVIHRRGAEDVALVSADDLRGYEETAYLMRSPKNARRLLTALARARSGKVKPMTVEQFRRESGIDDES